MMQEQKSFQDEESWIISLAGAGISPNWIKKKARDANISLTSDIAASRTTVHTVGTYSESGDELL